LWTTPDFGTRKSPPAGGEHASFLYVQEVAVRNGFAPSEPLASGRARLISRA